MVAVVYQGVAFPLLYNLLPKGGNSNTRERIKIMDRFICLFGRESIDCLTADRQFVGQQWIKYLNKNNIRYHILIRQNFQVLQPRDGKWVKASWLFSNLSLNTCRVNHRIVRVNNELCYLSGSKVINKSQIG